MSNKMYMLRISISGKLVVGLLLVALGFVPGLAQAQLSGECPVTPKTAIQSDQDPAVYYVTRTCTKRPFLNPDMFFSHFGDWNEVTTVSQGVLDLIPMDEYQFMPWGSRRAQANGALVKTMDAPDVYLILQGKRYHITSEAVFAQLGQSFSDVEDVDQDVIDAYPAGESLDGTGSLPAFTAVKYDGQPEVYMLVPDDAGNLQRRHIGNEAVFADLNYRFDRVVIIDESTTYPEAARINARADVDFSRQSRQMADSSSAHRVDESHVPIIAPEVSDTDNTMLPPADVFDGSNDDIDPEIEKSLLELGALLDNYSYQEFADLNTYTDSDFGVTFTNLAKMDFVVESDIDVIEETGAYAIYTVNIDITLPTEADCLAHESVSESSSDNHTNVRDPRCDELNEYVDDPFFSFRVDTLPGERTNQTYAQWFDYIIDSEQSDGSEVLVRTLDSDVKISGMRTAHARVTQPIISGSGQADSLTYDIYLAMEHNMLYVARIAHLEQHHAAKSIAPLERVLNSLQVTAPSRRVAIALFAEASTDYSEAKELGIVKQVYDDATGVRLWNRGNFPIIEVEYEAMQLYSRYGFDQFFYLFDVSEKTNHVGSMILASYTPTEYSLEQMAVLTAASLSGYSEAGFLDEDSILDFSERTEDGYKGYSITFEYEVWSERHLSKTYIFEVGDHVFVMIGIGHEDDFNVIVSDLDAMMEDIQLPRK